MFPLFESIKVWKGEICNAEWHNKRIERAFFSNYNVETKVNINDYFNPAEIKNELVKFRLSYNVDTFKSEYIPYQRKSINTLQLVNIDDSYTYDHKFTDRNQIKKYFNQRKNADDILMCQGQRLKDTSYANIVFRKKDKWYTPMFPLLEGTMRAKLIANKTIHAADIFIKDIPSFESFTLINAMNDLGEMPILSIDKIRIIK
jgi:4-amino-4-deoxychorismate lyase